jgi:hypothetical protein
MQHFYDAQIRRYLTQLVRMFSNFTYKDGKGTLVQVPVMYGDLTRQVASILRDNSENKIPSAPRMAVYITGLDLDRTRTSDSSYVNKLNIRERSYDADGNEYLKSEGKNYTVERLMPTPYTLQVNVDIWSTNTDQKLQLLEQILTLFNPSLEIQTTDNYVDWTSLSAVMLENVTFSSRSIPTGTESEIDVATLGFSTPIYLSAPAKVKKLGVITNIITAIFADNGLEINIDDTAYAESLVREAVEIQEDGIGTDLRNGKREALTSETTLVTTSHNNYDLLFMNGVAKLIGRNAVVGSETWTGYLKSIPRVFQPGITELRLQRRDGFGDIVGTATVNSLNETELVINIDPDTLPTDTTISGPNGDRSKIDYIIDPSKFDPRSKQSESPRILLLGNVGHTFKGTYTATTKTMVIDTGKPYDEVQGIRVLVNGNEVSTTEEQWNDSSNVLSTYKIKFANMLNIGDVVSYELYLDEDGPDAWKNNDGTDFAAFANDIVEWDGNRWHIVFDASATSTTTYTTNLNTGTQYKWEQGEWVLSYEGEYPDGTWRLAY